MKKAITSLIVFCCFFCFVVTANATTVDPNVKAINDAVAHVGNLEKAASLSRTTNLNVSAGIVISGLMGIIGIVALLFFIYGGLMWMTSEGADEALKKAQKTMIWAAIGLISVFLSYSVIVKVFTFSDVLYEDIIFDSAEREEMNPFNDETALDNALDEAAERAIPAIPPNDPSSQDSTYPETCDAEILNSTQLRQCLANQANN
jgi:hypothetical protein